MTDVLHQPTSLADTGDVHPSELEASPFYENGNRPEPDATPGGFQLVVQTARQLCDEPDLDSGRLLGPLVLQGARTIIVGATGEGKTTLTLQITRAILNGDDFLGWTGTSGGRALVIDLEQGRRSVKRSLRDAMLADRDDVDLVLVPDGLSLDNDLDQLVELDRVIADGRYTIVVLDPYYKAHRAAEPNAERPIVDLMRTLDHFRTKYGFALLLPAHPRKQPPGSPSIRKLTVDDISGAGAVSRGAEIVLGIERISHGYARLRFLKDREGELQIGEAYSLIYAKDSGYRRDPKDLQPDRDHCAEILALASDREWRTLRQFKEGIKAGETTVRNALAALVQDERLEYAIGPQGRNRDARCWRLADPNTPTLPLDDTNGGDDDIPF